MKAKVVKKQMVSISSDEEEIVKPVKKAAAPVGPCLSSSSNLCTFAD